MLQTLKFRINSCFISAIKMGQVHNPCFLTTAFDRTQAAKCGFNQMSYTGYDSCGPMSYAISPFLQMSNPELDLELRCRSYGYGRHLEDHVYLVAYIEGKKVIIDPTYRQFLTRYPQTSDPKYEQKLFHSLPPFWVGTLDGLEEAIDKVREIGDNPHHLIDVEDWWKKPDSAPPFELDFLECLRDPSYCKKKPKAIQRMVSCFEDLNAN